MKKVVDLAAAELSSSGALNSSQYSAQRVAGWEAGHTEAIALQTFSSNWQPPLIFLWFTLKSHEH